MEPRVSGVFLGNTKDSVWEDWGTLGNLREYSPLDPPQGCWGGDSLTQAVSILLSQVSTFSLGTPEHVALLVRICHLVSRLVKTRSFQ